MKKIVILFGLIGCISLVSVDYVQAQTFEELHRNKDFKIDSARKFVEEFGGAEGQVYLLTLKGKEDTSNKVMCGSSLRMCDKDTEVCLKCTCSFDNREEGAANKRSIDEYGKCVSKSAYEKSKNLRELWPDDGYCHESGPAWYQLGHWSACPITVAPEGFINSSRTEGFAHSSVREHIFTGADGKQYSLSIIDDKLTIAYSDSKSESFKGCEVFPVKVAELGGCFYCGLVNTIYSAAQSMAEKAFGSFSGPFRVLVGVIFAIWLVLISADYAFSMTKQDASKFLTSVLKMSFKIAIVYFLLAFPQDLFKYFIRPFLEAGLNLGTAIQVVDVSKDVGDLNQGMITISGDYYGSQLEERIRSYLGSLQLQFAYVQAMGSTLFCIGSHKFSFLDMIKSMGDAMDALRMMFLGAFLFIVALLFTISFGFYLVDALLHLILLAAMLPLMIATWPLPFKTTKFASSGFQMFLNVFFTFFFVGFVVSMAVHLLEESLDVAVSINSEVTNEFHKEAAQSFQNIVDAIYEQDFNKLNRATDIGLYGFLILIFGFIFGFKFTSEAPKLAGKLSGGGAMGLAPKVATMGASLAKGAATRISKPFAESAAEKYHEAGGLVGMTTGAVSWAAGKVQEKAGTDSTIGKAFGTVSKGFGKVRGFSKKVHSAYRKKI